MTPISHDPTTLVALLAIAIMIFTTIAMPSQANSAKAAIAVTTTASN